MVSASDLHEVDDLAQSLESLAGKSGGDFPSITLYLQLVRKHKLRRSETVTRHGMTLLNSKLSRSSLRNEYWTVLEQVAIAAMDCQSHDAAKECVGMLLGRFPNSSRVGRLEGMWHESKGWWDQAERVYDDLLEINPANQAVHKRRIAMLKGQGKAAGVVEALNKYLELWSSDYEAWRELGEVYISSQMYKQAAFCYEELLLSSPHNALFNLTYAELLYSVGGLENLRTARAYYSAAVEYSGGKNLRALYGTCLCSSAITLATKSGRGQKEEKESPELALLASEVIIKEYRTKCTERAKEVASIFEKMVI